MASLIKNIKALVSTHKSGELFEMTVDGNNTVYNQYEFYRSEIAEFKKYLTDVKVGTFNSGGSWLTGIVK